MQAKQHHLYYVCAFVTYYKPTLIPTMSQSLQHINLKKFLQNSNEIEIKAARDSYENADNHLKDLQAKIRAKVDTKVATFYKRSTSFLSTNAYISVWTLGYRIEFPNKFKRKRKIASHMKLRYLMLICLA